MAKSLTGAILVLASWVDLCVVATQGAKVSKVSIRLLLRFLAYDNAATNAHVNESLFFCGLKTPLQLITWGQVSNFRSMAFEEKNEYCINLGSAKANGREPPSCMGRVFNFKQGCFVMSLIVRH